MKGGVNVWRALRDTQDLHPAWMHIDRPYREEDLPRRINIEEKAAAGSGKAGKGAAEDATRASGKAARANGPAANGKDKDAIQRAIEIEANHEADELGVVAL
jgi:hypothetical protein